MKAKVESKEEKKLRANLEQGLSKGLKKNEKLRAGAKIDWFPVSSFFQD